MIDKRRDINLLMEKIGYSFEDLSLLETALTHRSYHSKNNERLEFLGDAVLCIVITKALYNTYPDLQEGRLTRLRAHLVKGETLFEVAKEFNLGDYILLGQGEKLSGGFERKSILADALEAVIGAIYLDSGIESCETVLNVWFKDRINNVIKSSADKDPKTMLQEFLQAKALDLPVYEIESITGSSLEQEFNVTCTVGNIITKGTGRSRRFAEQEAAKLALVSLKEMHS